MTLESIPPSRVYEFTEPQNRDISRLAAGATLWGALAGFAAAFFALTTVLVVIGPDRGRGAFYHVVASASFGAVAFAFLGAGRALRAVVTTTGKDMHHLTVAFGQVAMAMRIQAFAAAVALVGWGVHLLFG